MSVRLKSIRVQNYRSLGDVPLELEPVNVLFGPNGAGKSSLLDAIWFVRDCAIRGVELASSVRDHGIGLLFDGADESDPIRLKFSTDRAEYELTLSLSGGRINLFAGERLYSLDRHKVLLDRETGATKVDFLEIRTNQTRSVGLREPEKLSLGRYLDSEPNCEEATDLASILDHVHLYDSRTFNLNALRKLGSQTGYDTWVMDRADNLWSVLRNIEGRRQLDDRYATIMKYVAEAFPTFGGLVIEPTAPSVLYASFLEKGRRKPILASGISDADLQLLILLTTLFSEGRGRYSLLLFDEPESSLHPWAIAVLAKAIKQATEEWGRQVILATHSPVLISQFDPDQTLAVEQEDGRTRITRLSEIAEIQDLLEEYASGSLYMSELVAAQSNLVDLSTPSE